MSLTPTNNLSPCRWHRWTVFRRCCWHRRKILGFLVISLWQGLIPGVNDTGDKFFAGVIDTAEQFIAGVVDIGDKYSFGNISANFQKNSKRSNGILGGLGDTDSWKNLKLKNSCQTPFKWVQSKQWKWSKSQTLMFVWLPQMGSEWKGLKVRPLMFVWLV